MRNLLYKELRLSSHPTNWLFPALSAMMLIPDYPLAVCLFYTTLGMFFVCLTGRENNDIYYSVTLPIRKSDAVRARFLFFAVLELVQLLTCGLFMLLRHKLDIGPNAVGMDANVAFFGVGLGLFGLFHLSFFPLYYKNPQAVGRPFFLSSAVCFVYIGLVEALCHTAPLFRDVLDTPDPAHMGVKLLCVLAGLLLWLASTLLALRRSLRSFETIDL